MSTTMTKTEKAILESLTNSAQTNPVEVLPKSRKRDVVAVARLVARGQVRIVSENEYWITVALPAAKE